VALLNELFGEVKPHLTPAGDDYEHF
jgi:hypothetical protein